MLIFNFFLIIESGFYSFNIWFSGSRIRIQVFLSDPVWTSRINIHKINNFSCIIYWQKWSYSVKKYQLYRLLCQLCKSFIGSGSEFFWGSDPDSVFSLRSNPDPEFFVGMIRIRVKPTGIRNPANNTLRLNSKKIYRTVWDLALTACFALFICTQTYETGFSAFMKLLYVV